MNAVRHQSDNRGNKSQYGSTRRPSGVDLAGNVVEDPLKHEVALASFIWDLGAASLNNSTAIAAVEMVEAKTWLK